MQHQLAVTGKEAAYICVLLCGNETRILKVTRSESVIQHIVNAERYLWDCVEKDTPPEAYASASAAKALSTFSLGYLILFIDSLTKNDKRMNLK